MRSFFIFNFYSYLQVGVCVSVCVYVCACVHVCGGTCMPVVVMDRLTVGVLWHLLFYF